MLRLMEKNFFDQPAKNDIRACDKHSKNWDDYTTGCMLDYVCFKNYEKMKSIDLSKEEALMLTQKQYSKSISLEIYIDNVLHY